MDDNEKVKHIENIDKSMKWLRENNLWEDFREIVLDGIVELSNNYRKERAVNFDFIDFGERKDYSKEWNEKIKKVIKLTDIKDNKPGGDVPYDKEPGD